MERIFRGKTTEQGRIVEVECDGETSLLSHETNRNVFETDRDYFDHSPKLYDWGYDGQTADLLARAILFAVTDDAKLALSYYQFFKTDYVSRWGENWEMSEYEVHAWLRAVGAANV